MLGAALRDRGVQLGAAILAVYVGLEASVGDWGFSYLVQARGLTESLAGYAVSGYWLGMTLGRFLISPIATRAGVTTAGMMYACLAGVTACRHACRMKERRSADAAVRPGPQLHSG
jgi:fucose permease